MLGGNFLLRRLFTQIREIRGQSLSTTAVRDLAWALNFLCLSSQSVGVGLRCRFAKRDDCNALLGRLAAEGFPVKQDGAIGFDGEHGTTGAGHRVEGFGADSGDVEAHVLLRLGDFHDGESAAGAQLAGALDALVGAFDGFDGDHGLIFDADALADVELAHALGNLPTELDVRLLFAGEPTTGNMSGLDEQVGSEISGRFHGDSIAGESLYDCAE